MQKFKFAIILPLIMCACTVHAEMFQREADKGVWIKEHFKGKKVYHHNPKIVTKAEDEIMNAFLKQKDIEYIEPDTIGKDINDPNIAPFNKICPKDKPINVSRIMVRNYFPSTGLQEHGHEQINICLEKMKIFKINPYGDAADGSNYVLWCENYGSIEFYDIKRKQRYVNGKPIVNSNGVFLGFSTKTCEYSEELLLTQFYDPNSDITGIFKHNNKVYFYKMHPNSLYPSGYSVMIWHYCYDSKCGFCSGAIIR